jgi:Transposase, Mutator family
MSRSVSSQKTQTRDDLAGAPGVPGNGPARRPLRELIDDRVLDELLERSKDAAGGLRLTGEGSMLGELVRAVLERALEAEMTAHLGYEKSEQGGRAGGDGNARNGKLFKTVQTGVGPVPLQVPRDRAGTFEPLLIPKRADRVAGGLDDMVISLYAHGMTCSDIVHHLNQVYGTQLSGETVSRITDAVLEEVKAWQSRPLDPVYAAVFLDAIVVKVRDNHVVQNKPAYVAIGVDADGEKHVLGIWIAKTAPGDAAAGEGSGGRSWPTFRTAGCGTSSSPASTGLPGSATPSPGRSRARSSSAVLSILSGTPFARWPAATPPGSRRNCGRSAPPRTPTPRSTPWPSSPPRPGDGSTRRPRRCSRPPGTTSSRFSTSPPCPEAPVHHKQHRKPELSTTQSDQSARSLPDR